MHFVIEPSTEIQPFRLTMSGGKSWIAAPLRVSQ